MSETAEQRVEACVEGMRRDFPLAALGEAWDGSEQEAIGEAVREAMAAGDEEALGYWARRIQVAADAWRDWCARVRAMEARIREAARARREKGDDPAAV